MSDAELEKTKVIAEYDPSEHIDTFEVNNPHVCKYNASFDWQIPVWSKAVKYLNKPNVPFYKLMDFTQRYYKAIDNNSVETAFNVLHETITFINQKPNN